MKNNKNKIRNNTANELWSTSWTYIRTVIDTAREPFLILDRDLRIIAVNSCFLRTFEVSDKNTEGRLVYDLGNCQWNIPSLKDLLEDILPKDTFFKDFEVDHDFPELGRRIMVLNARKIFSTKKSSTASPIPPLILLAMEDVTDKRLISEKLAEYAQNIETQMDSKIKGITTKFDELANLHKIIADRDSQVATLKEKIKESKK